MMTCIHRTIQYIHLIPSMLLRGLEFANRRTRPLSHCTADNLQFIQRESISQSVFAVAFVLFNLY